VPRGFVGIVSADLQALGRDKFFEFVVGSPARLVEEAEHRPMEPHEVGPLFRVADIQCDSNNCHAWHRNLSCLSIPRRQFVRVKEGR
jgi:hypothetical protein